MALAAHSRQIGGQEGNFIKVLYPLYSHLSAVSEGADQLDGDSLVIEELALNLQYAVNWVRAVQDGGYNDEYLSPIIQCQHVIVTVLYQIELRYDLCSQSKPFS